MSFRRFDLDKDVFMGEGFVEEDVSLTPSLLAIAGAGYPSPSAFNDSNDRFKFYNHYVTGGVSGSFYLDVFDRNSSDFAATRLVSYTYGHTTSSVYFTGSGFSPSYQDQKTRMYKMMAQRLLGNKNSVFKTRDGVFDQAFFICISRNQFKDSIKKKDINITLFGSASALTNLPGMTPTIGIYSSVDLGEHVEVREYSTAPSSASIALVYPKAGVIVLNPRQIDIYKAYWSGTYNFDVLAKGVSGTTYNDLLWGCASRVRELSFTSMSKVVSSYFICKAGKSEFNYSSNPSFLNAQGQNVTNLSSSLSTTYITTVALLGENHEVLAVAKLKEPLRKDPRTNYEITVRLAT